MHPFQPAPLRESPVDRLDSRTLADIGIDRFGNALERNDPRFRGHRRTRGIFTRLIDTILARTSGRLGLSPTGGTSALEQELD